MTRVAGLDVGLSLDSGSFESGAVRARRVMQQSLAGIQQDVSKSRVALEGMTSALGGFAGGLAKVAVGYASFQTIGAVLKKAVTEFAEAENSSVRFAAVLKATGSAAGISASGMAEFADQMARSRVVTAEAVTDAGSILATFKSVTGDTFTRAIELAQDLSSVFGQDLSASAVQLGKALEDPVAGLSALRRVGVSFTDAQKDVIQALVDTGRAAEAQRIILDQLAAQVGGAGEAAGNTLTGAFHRFTEELGNSLAALYEWSGQAREDLQLLETLTGAMQGLRLGPSQTPAAIIGRAESELRAVEQRMASESSAFGGGSKKELLELEQQATSLRAIIARADTELDRVNQKVERRVSQPIATGPGAVGRSMLDAYNAELKTTQVLSERAITLQTQQREAAAKQAAEAKKAGEDAAAQAKRTADEVKREAEHRAAIITALRQGLTAAEQMTAVAGEGAFQAELTRIEIERQQELQKVSLQLKGEELDLAKQLINATAQAARRRASIETPVPTERPTDIGSLRLQAERESMESLAEFDRSRFNKQTKETRDFANLQRDILIRPWEELAVDISRVMGGVFDQILRDAGGMDFGDVAEGFADTFSTAISGALGNIVTGPLQIAVSRLAESALDPNKGFLSGLKSIAGTPTGGAMLSGGAGFIGGSLLAQVTGGNSQFGGLGGGIGAGGGFLLGNMLAPGIGGPIGAGIGGLAGGLLGGLFGSENNLGNDRSAQVFNPRRGNIYSDVSFSPENRNITQGIITDLETLSEALSDLGATFDKFNLRIEAGNKTGITVNGKKYATAQDALRGSLEQLIGGTTGLSATQQTILGRTKGGTSQEILKDVAFGDTFDQLTFKGTDTERALNDLATTMQAAGLRAAALGLDVGALAEAHQKAAAAIAAEEDARQRALQIQRQALQTQLEMTAPASGTDAIAPQFQALEFQFQELGRAAVELGVPFELVTAAHQRAADALNNTIQQQQRSLQVQIRSTAPVGTDAIAAQFDVLELQFQELARAAANLNIPIKEVTDAHERAARALQIDVATTVNDVWVQLQQIGGQNDAAVALFQLNVALAKVAAEARKFGIPESAIADTTRLAQQNLVFQRDQQLRSTNETLAALAGDNSLATQLHVLETQFRTLAKTAADLGIPLAHVNAQKAKAIQLARDEDAALRQNFRNEVQAVAPVGSDLAVALAQLDQRMAELRRRAIELGEGLGQVDAAAARARAELIAQNARAQQSLTNELAAIAPAGSGLVIALTQLDLRMAELRIRASDLGVSLSLVDQAAARARAEILAEHARARTDLEHELQTISRSGNILEIALAEIDDRFIDLRERAVELGVSLTTVNAAQTRARDEAIRDYNERRQDLLNEVDSLGLVSLAADLAGIRDRFRDLRKSLDEVGLATVDLTAKQREAEKRAIAEAERQATTLERTVIDQQRGIRDFFTNLIEPLRAANQNTLAPIGQIQGARRRFTETAALARGGDVEAIRDLGARSQELLALREQFLGSGGLGAEILREVTAVTQGVIGSLEMQQREAMASVPDVIRETTAEAIRVMIEENKKTLEELAAIRREIARERLRAA